MFYRQARRFLMRSLLMLRTDWQEIKDASPPLTEIVNIGLLSVGLQFNNLILRI